MKGLIINADDFGPSDFINRGIIEGIEKGVINSTSAFVTFDDKCLRNIENLHRNYPQVKIGLHISLTAGMPSSKSDVSSLMRDGKFYAFEDMKMHPMKESQVALEIEAQFNALAQALGGKEKIDHINSHLGITSFYDRFWNPFRMLLEQYNLPTRNPLSAGQKGKYKESGLMPIQKYAIQQGARNIEHPYSVAILLQGVTRHNLLARERDAIQKKIKMPDYFVTHYYGQPGIDKLNQVVDAISDGEIAELMVHVGKGNSFGENYWGIDVGYYTTRKMELFHLLNKDFKKRMEDKGVQLVGYPK